MHLVVLGQPGGWHTEQIERAAREAGRRTSRVDWMRLTARVEHGQPRVFADDIELTAVDAVIVRAMPSGSLEQVVFRMDALARVQAAGVPVINPPKAIECAVDKFLATARIAEAGLPTPPTAVCETRDAAMEAFLELGGDVLVKPIFGSEGRGILRVSDREIAYRTFGTLQQLGAVLYVQRFLSSPGFDVRVLVLDGRVLGAIERRCRDDFRANVAQKAEAQPHRCTDQERSYALRAAEAVGCRFAGVDLLYDTAGCLYVIEVNAAPGWRALQQATGCDVARELIRAVLSRP